MATSAISKLLSNVGKSSIAERDYLYPMAALERDKAFGDYRRMLNQQDAKDRAGIFASTFLENMSRSAQAGESQEQFLDQQLGQFLNQPGYNQLAPESRALVMSYFRDLAQQASRAQATTGNLTGSQAITSRVGLNPDVSPLMVAEQAGDVQSIARLTGIDKFNTIDEKGNLTSSSGTTIAPESWAPAAARSRSQAGTAVLQQADPLQNAEREITLQLLRRLVGGGTLGQQTPTEAILPQASIPAPVASAVPASTTTLAPNTTTASVQPTLLPSELLARSNPTGADLLVSQYGSDSLPNLDNVSDNGINKLLQEYLNPASASLAGIGISPETVSALGETPEGQDLRAYATALRDELSRVGQDAYAQSVLGYTPAAPTERADLSLPGKVMAGVNSVAEAIPFSLTSAVGGSIARPELEGEFANILATNAASKLAELDEFINTESDINKVEIAKRFRGQLALLLNVMALPDGEQKTAEIKKLLNAPLVTVGGER